MQEKLLEIHDLYKEYGRNEGKTVALDRLSCSVSVSYTHLTLPTTPYV